MSAHTESTVSVFKRALRSLRAQTARVGVSQRPPQVNYALRAEWQAEFLSLVDDVQSRQPSA
jgi:hypothetical protein